MKIETMTDDDIGRMVREAVRQKNAAKKEFTVTRSGLAEFLEDIGLKDIADLVRAVADIWKEVKDWLNGLFN